MRSGPVRAAAGATRRRPAPSRWARTRPRRYPCSSAATQPASVATGRGGAGAGPALAAGPAPLPGLREHRREHLLVEAVAADAEVPIRRARCGARARLIEEPLLAPTVGEAHALRMSHRDRLVGRDSHQRLEDVDQVVLEQAPDREAGLDAARIHGAVRLDRHLRAVVAMAQEVEPARPAVAEV